MEEWMKDVEKKASNPENILDNQRVLQLIDHIQALEALIQKKDEALREAIRLLERAYGIANRYTVPIKQALAELDETEKQS